MTDIAVRRAELVAELTEVGWASIADMVRHGILPDNSYASLIDIWGWCEERDYNVPAGIIDAAIAEMEGGE